MLANADVRGYLRPTAHRDSLATSAWTPLQGTVTSPLIFVMEKLKPVKSEPIDAPEDEGPGVPIKAAPPFRLPILDGGHELRPVLQNIVSTVNLKCKLDLKSIAMRARNAEYSPKRFAAVIMRIREPRTTALIFSSGKMVCTGAKSEDQCRLASRKYARIIQKLGFETQFCDFTIQNIVGSCDVGFPVRLESIAFVHGTFSTYEPELFPGLVYRMVNPRIVILIFVSGKVVLTGAKKR